jgi:hypothetical protein
MVSVPASKALIGDRRSRLNTSSASVVFELISTVLLFIPYFAVAATLTT